MKDRDLVRLYWPVELRASFDALMALDDAMAEVVVGASQPALAAITLAWWREALERLDTLPPPAEPRLQAVARLLLPRGISGHDLSKLETGWAGLLHDEAGGAEASLRGRSLFKLAARLLGRRDADGSGELFGRADLLRRSGESRWRGEVPSRSWVTGPLRPLTALDALARRDLLSCTAIEPEATPQRAWTLLHHRWTGRI